MSNLDETPAAMQIDEDHDEDDDSDSPPNLRNLPLELYPKIAGCLDYILGGNEDYLRHIVASINTRSVEAVVNAKAKILQWMGSNPNWTERCGDLAQASQSFCRFSIRHSNYDKLNLHQYQPGVISFQGYVGKEHTGELPQEGDLLHDIGKDLLAAEWTLDEINGIISEVELKRSPGWTHDFAFLKDANFIFGHPIVAIAFGLEPVLRHMLVSGIVNIRDRYSFDLNFSLAAMEDWGLPLLYHAVTWSPDISCFQYIISLQDIHSTFHANGVNLIHWCATSSKKFSLSALEMALRHSQAPGINDFDRNGVTALWNLCGMRGIPLELRRKKLEILLAFNADPKIGDPLPIDSLRQLFDKQIQNARSRQKRVYNEMVALLEGRSASTSS